MNPYHYLESRFVTSQVALNRKQVTSGLGENHAIRAWMWIGLKLTTLYYLFMIFFQYLGVLFHILDRPPTAREVATAEAERQIAAKKMVDEVAEKMKSEGIASIGPMGVA